MNTFWIDMKIRRAFTLIELLVVMAIIALLSTLLFGLIASSSDAQERSKTESILSMLTASIDLFTNETGSVPLPTGSLNDPGSGSWYPDTVDGSWEKQQLWWRVNHTMTADERVQMDAAATAADIAADPYQSKSYVYDTYPSNRRLKIQELVNTISDAEAESYKGYYTGSDWISSEIDYPDVDSRADLRVRGQVKALLLAVRGEIARNITQRSYFTYPTLSLADLADESLVNDQCMLDVWENPLIYVAYSTPEMPHRYPSWKSSSGMKPVWSPAGGRIEMTDRNGDGTIDDLDWAVAPEGDALVDHDASGSVNKNDWANILYYAMEGNRSGFYLASAGSDGLFNCVLPDSVNADNVVAANKW